MKGPRGALKNLPRLSCLPGPTRRKCAHETAASVRQHDNVNRILSLCFLVVAVIHLLPLAGVIGAPRLSTLYGLDVNEPNLEILLRHRAVLFGILGGIFVYAALRAHMRTVALVIGLTSVVSFLLLAYTVGGYNLQVARVVWADWIALAALLVAATAQWRLSRAGAR